MPMPFDLFFPFVRHLPTLRAQRHAHKGSAQGEKEYASTSHANTPSGMTELQVYIISSIADICWSMAEMRFAI